MRERLGDDALWADLSSSPSAAMLRSSLETDIARGIALTDGLIGTFSSADDESLRQNRCFLYHVIGGGTGDWDVPVGGMGRVSGELERAAREAGAELRTNAEVTAVSPDGEVVGRRAGRDAPRKARAQRRRAGGPRPTARSRRQPASARSPAPEGAQVKVNMLLRRLPRLRDDRVAPEAAFAGTFHINETMSQLDAAFATASGGGIPNPLPAEIYCHSLTDPSILGPELRASGAQTLTLFGLQVPHRLVAGMDRDAARSALQDAAMRTLDSVLAFSGAGGEVTGVAIGTNSTGFPNLRATIKLKKQAPK